MLFLILIFILIIYVVILISSNKISYSSLKLLIISNYSLLLLIVWINFFSVVILESSYKTIQWNWAQLGCKIVNFSFINDNLTSIMLIVVISISSIVHVYSLEYMKNDPHLNKFMSYLSLFTLLMTILVSSSNLLILFIGWEGVGVCSFLLISFWYQRVSAIKSALKAILLNRVGDLGFIIGTLIIWEIYGSLNFSSINGSFFNVENVCNFSLFFFILAISGKSAQFGLHSWLPDAMEGPTPVSALIHAATMVTAGVFLIVRMSNLFSNSNEAMLLMLLIGSLTSFFAASTGLVQNDFKKVIAYSTCSQLGYMVLICGVSQFSLGLFHLFNHAFFKALLFLSAGSLIHSLSDEQDFRKSGNLVWSNPLSSITIFIGSFALMGIPFLTGFYSKEAIIELSNSNSLISYGVVVSLISALMTSIYSFRLIFWGILKEEKGGYLTKKLVNESPVLLTINLFILGVFSIIIGQFFNNIFKIEFVPIIGINVKLIPLIFSFIGVVVAISVQKFLVSNNINFNYFNFLGKAWNIDLILNKSISGIILNFSDYFYFKIDRGILEKIGPQGAFYSIYRFLFKFYFIYKTNFINYFFVLFLFLSFYLYIV